MLQMAAVLLSCFCSVKEPTDPVKSPLHTSAKQPLPSRCAETRARYRKKRFFKKTSLLFERRSNNTRLWTVATYHVNKANVSAAKQLLTHIPDSSKESSEFDRLMSKAKGNGLKHIPQGYEDKHIRKEQRFNGFNSYLQREGLLCLL